MAHPSGEGPGAEATPEQVVPSPITMGLESQGVQCPLEPPHTVRRCRGCDGPAELGTASVPQIFLQVQKKMKQNTILKLCLIKRRENENIQPEGERPIITNLVSCSSLKYNFSQMDLICTVAIVTPSLYCSHTILLSLTRKFCNCLCLILYLLYSPLLSSTAPNKIK